jgi:hypothetical protein
LRDENFLTRDQINEEFSRKGIVASGLRLSYIMMNAELEGLICSGPRMGRQFTYALLDERAPPNKPLSREESLALLATRYFTSRGPATMRDFATWSGLKVSDCKQGIEMVQRRLVEEKIEGRVYYSGATQVKPRELPRMMILPIYDEYIMGYKDRSAILHVRRSTSPAPKLRYPATIVWDGQVVGTWRRVVKNDTVQTEFDFFNTPSKEQEGAFRLAYGRLKAFSQVELEDISHVDNS